MVPPGDIGPIPIWVGVYVLFLLAAGAGGFAIYQRVFRLVLQGRSEARFDRPWERLSGAMAIVLGQKKVLQRVPFGDWAGLGHAAIFWGFLTFMLSYAIYIFGAVAWKPFPEWLLTETGAMVYSSYLDVLSAVLLAVLIWAAARRWVVRPRRLSYDLTRNPDASHHRRNDRRIDGLDPAHPHFLCGRGRDRPGGRRHYRRSRGAAFR